MVSKKLIEKLTNKHQTTEVNVVREYCQHLFLSYLYQMKKTEYILFKGGTALRIIYNSPRFSEDLDFTCFRIGLRDIEEIFVNVIEKIEDVGINVGLEESKSTSGGYLAKFQFKFLNYEEGIRIECSFRKKTRIKPDVILINSNYIPPFNILCLPCKQLVEEKIDALLKRGKPRDYYDIYFLLRADLPIDKKNLRLGQVLRKLSASQIDFKKELTKLVSKKHHAILRDFKKILSNEIKGYGY
jgi:predicted nucleotidyltransferase component of viral defense system